MPPERRPEDGPSREPRGGATPYARAAVVVGAVTFVASFVRSVFHVPDVEMLFFLGITVVATTSTRGPSVFAAVLSVAAYDFFFVAPSFTLAVEDARYLLTFLMMLGIGVVMSNLTARLREQERATAAREVRTAVLYQATRGFAAALDAPAVGAACAGAAYDVLSTPALLLERRGEALVPLAGAPAGTAPTAIELEAARWTAAQGNATVAGAGPFAEVPAATLPVRTATEVIAVLVVRLPAGEGLSADRREFLEALCRQAGLALERVRLAAEVRATALRAEAEQLRSSLLSAVSHDLRTPLATITGAATTLRDGGALADGTRRDLVEAICDEAERLERLVRNLLDMTRLETGEVKLRREWVPVEEIVGSALTRLDRLLAGREVSVTGLDALPLLHVDPVLLEQLFVNVVENATKYTPGGTPIEVRGSRRGSAIEIEVADHGPGVPPGMEELVFDRFRRGQHESVPGTGLGLAIARAVARAHRGDLVVRNRSGGGAAFTLTLPGPEGAPGSAAEEGT